MEYRLLIDGREVARSGAIRPLLRSLDIYTKQFQIKTALIELVSGEDNQND